MFHKNIFETSNGSLKSDLNLIDVLNEWDNNNNINDDYYKSFN